MNAITDVTRIEPAAARRARTWADEFCAQLARPWILPEIERLHAELDHISVDADASGLADLANAAIETSVYLCSFVTEYGGPNASQCERLVQLAGDLREFAIGHAPHLASVDPVPAPTAPPPPPLKVAPPAAPRPAPAPAAPPVLAPSLRAEPARIHALCVSGDPGMVASLEVALARHNVALTACTPLDDVVAAVPPFGVQCVIADADALGVLHELEYNSTKLARREAARPTFVALMPSNDTSDRLQALRAGADHVLVRGDMDQLAARLQRIVQEHHEEPLRVLVVDDDRSQAVFCHAVLRRFGVAVVTTDDPRQVPELVRIHHPDVILVDLYMPEVDGLMLTEQLLAMPALDHVAILFLSGDAEPDTRFVALAAGGDDFLTKPIQPRHLIRAVLGHGKRAQRRRRRLSHVAP